MNKERQRIKIAEACGWTRNKFEHWVAPEGRCIVELWPHDERGSPPHYLSDLNAIYDAEEILLKKLPWPENWTEYIKNLSNVAGFSYCDADEEDETEADYCARICHATAEQRAEALLRTLNLWED
jgi:hypothetical protein